MTEFNDQSYAEKIRKLLDKAESTESEHEAEALRERAFLLMEKYAITDAMISSAKPIVREEIIEKEVSFTGRFAKANRRITSAIAAAFDCRCVVLDHNSYWDKRNKNEHYDIRVHGFQSDVEKVLLLDASLQIQAVRALKAWEKSIDLRNDPRPQWDKFKMRRSFILGFASGAGSKLTKARREAEAEVAAERAAASGEDTVVESSSVALVLRDRKDSVNDWMDQRYGNGLRKSRGFTAGGGYGSWNAGHAAGQRADTGQGGLGGSRRALH